MRGAAVEHAQVDVRARRLREALEKVLDQFGLEIADALCIYFAATNTIRTAAEIDSCGRKCFIHGHQEISGAQDAAFCPERFQYRLAKRNSRVFHGVMLVDLEVALASSVRSNAPCRARRSNI